MVFVSKKGSWKTIPWFTKGMQQLSVYLAYHFKTDFAPSDLTKTIREKSLPCVVIVGPTDAESTIKIFLL